MKKKKRKINKEVLRYLDDAVYSGIDGGILSLVIIAGVISGGLNMATMFIIGFGSLVAIGLLSAGKTFLKIKRIKKTKKLYTISTVVSFLSFLIIGSIPFFPYIASYNLYLDSSLSFPITNFLMIPILAGLGFLKGFLLKIEKLQGVVETLFLSGIAIVSAFYIGMLIKILT